MKTRAIIIGFPKPEHSRESKARMPKGIECLGSEKVPKSAQGFETVQWFYALRALPGPIKGDLKRLFGNRVEFARNVVELEAFFRRDFPKWSKRVADVLTSADVGFRITDQNVFNQIGHSVAWGTGPTVRLRRFR
jgi:hypothetical protein